MAQLPVVQKLKQTETEIAVLQVQYEHLSEKVEDIKTGLKDLATHIDTHMEATHKLIKDFQDDNQKQHTAVEKKISALEKWRWMLMGAGILAGSLGFPMIQKILGI